jgi:hypothetical protein
LTPGEIGRLTDETIRLSVQLGETTGLLLIAVQYAWLDGWVQGCRQATAGVEEMLEREARTNRLVRQGVPFKAAARGLRLV